MRYLILDWIYHFERHAFCARGTGRVNSVMVAAGKCYGLWYMARNTPPWPCLIPTRTFLRIHDEERPQRRAEGPCSCATRKSRGPVAISRRLFSSLWSAYSLLPEILHYSGNPCIPSAIPANPQISFYFINIYTVYLTKWDDRIA